MPRATCLGSVPQGLCPHELGDPEGCVPSDLGRLSDTPEWPLTFPSPAGERAGSAGQVRGQRRRLGGRRAVPLRGQPRVLSPGRAPHRPRPPSRPPPRHRSHPASTPATQGSRHAGRGRGERPAGRPHAASADGMRGPGQPGPGGSHPGAPLAGGSGRAVRGGGQAAWGAGGEAWGCPCPAVALQSWSLPPLGRLCCVRHVHPVYQIA